MEKDRRIIKVVFRILMISGFCLLGISCHYHAIIGKSDLKTISQECIEDCDTEIIIKYGVYSGEVILYQRGNISKLIISNLIIRS